MVARVLGVATVVAAFIILAGSWRATPAALFKLAAQTLAFAWTGSMLGLFSARFVARFPIWNTNFWLAGLVTGMVMAGPMCAVVWLVETVTEGHAPPLSALPGTLWTVAIISIGASCVAVLLNRRAAAAVALAAAAPAPPKFLERLPLKLRGAEVWAVEAEDHYLRLHTSKGQDLILLRLADAVAELDGIEGAQVHRSWWVARDAIVDAKRGDGRAVLTLKDGAEVPVSRTYAGQLRERGWI
jgi:hypothetical protein